MGKACIESMGLLCLLLWLIIAGSSIFLCGETLKVVKPLESVVSENVVPDRIVSQASRTVKEKLPHLHNSRVFIHIKARDATTQYQFQTDLKTISLRINATLFRNESCSTLIHSIEGWYLQNPPLLQDDWIKNDPQLGSLLRVQFVENMKTFDKSNLTGCLRYIKQTVPQLTDTTNVEVTVTGHEYITHNTQQHCLLEFLLFQCTAILFSILLVNRITIRSFSLLLCMTVTAGINVLVSVASLFPLSSHFSTVPSYLPQLLTCFLGTLSIHHSQIVLKTYIAMCHYRTIDRTSCTHIYTTIVPMTFSVLLTSSLHALLPSLIILLAGAPLADQLGIIGASLCLGIFVNFGVHTTLLPYILHFLYPILKKHLPLPGTPNQDTSLHPHIDQQQQQEQEASLLQHMYNSNLDPSANGQTLNGNAPRLRGSVRSLEEVSSEASSFEPSVNATFSGVFPIPKLYPKIVTEHRLSTESFWVRWTHRMVCRCQIGLISSALLFSICVVGCVFIRLHWIKLHTVYTRSAEYRTYQSVVNTFGHDTVSPSYLIINTNDDTKTDHVWASSRLRRIPDDFSGAAANLTDQQIPRCGAKQLADIIVGNGGDEIKTPVFSPMFFAISQHVWMRIMGIENNTQLQLYGASWMGTQHVGMAEAHCMMYRWSTPPTAAEATYHYIFQHLVNEQQTVCGFIMRGIQQHQSSVATTIAVLDQYVHNTGNPWMGWYAAKHYQVGIAGHPVWAEALSELLNKWIPFYLVVVYSCTVVVYTMVLTMSIHMTCKLFICYALNFVVLVGTTGGYSKLTELIQQLGGVSSDAEWGVHPLVLTVAIPIALALCAQSSWLTVIAITDHRQYTQNVKHALFSTVNILYTPLMCSSISGLLIFGSLVVSSQPFLRLSGVVICVVVLVNFSVVHAVLLPSLFMLFPERISWLPNVHRLSISFLYSPIKRANISVELEQMPFPGQTNKEKDE